MLKQITIKLIKWKLFQNSFWVKQDLMLWCLPRDDEENSTYLAWMGSGQFFVRFVIHLQTKLELFILQQNAVLFLTARFF